MEANLTIQGLYNYDNSIFDGLTVPDGMDKELLIRVIIVKNMCFSLLYPDAEIMKNFIKVWSDSEKDIWDKIYKTEHYEYNAIDNYDRYEEYKDESNGKQTNNADSTNYVAAYNTLAMSDQSKNTQFASSYYNNGITHTAHLHGNIGVTTTQRMIAEEREIVNFCTYDFISDSFRDNFCVRVF